MDKEKVVEVLEDLKCYVTENWDETEFKKEMDEAEEALNDSISGIVIEPNEIKPKSQHGMPRPESLDPAASLRMKIQ